MEMLRCRFRLSTIIAFFLVLSMLLIMGIVARDYGRSPDDSFIVGMRAMERSEYVMAERGFLRAMRSGIPGIVSVSAYRLGLLYSAGHAGVPRDGVKATGYFLLAASNGILPAQYQLALLYDVGDKVPENRDKAKVWMERAADGGLIDAVYALGVWHERGYYGAPNLDVAVPLYERAAQAGHLNAMKSLAAIYGSGYGAFPDNLEKSSHWMNEIKRIEGETCPAAGKK
ncbi:MAG: tetratricopeptide repeat protein [Alphaproteobacteria bacterium]|nr:tetratricopeptide repeat protein [Alphaproteobacteria bacterium]